MFAPGIERHVKVVLGADTGRFKAGMSGATSALKKFKVAAALVGAAVVALGAVVFVKAIKAAAEFEQAMAMVKAVTGATAEEFALLEKKSKELGKTSKFTMTDIAAGMEFLARAGFETTEIISAMDGVVALASSQVMDLGRAADITSNILTGMGLTATEAGRVADVLAQTAASANVNVEMLGESFKYAAPLAAAAGWSIEETAAAIGKMGDAGIQGSMAGTALRFTLSELIGESDLFQEKLGDLGMVMDDLKGPDGSLLGMAEVFGVFEERGFGAKEMLDLFGKRAGPAMAILLEQGTASLADYTTALENAGGAAQRMADIQLDTLSGQLEILKGSWELLLVTIGEDMMPILKNILKDHIIPLVNGITEWIEKMGGLKGIMGHMLISIGKYIQAVAIWIKSHGFLAAGLDKLVEGFKRIWAFVTKHSGAIIKAIIAIGAAFAAWQVVAWVASLNPLTLALGVLAVAGLAVAAFWPEITAAWTKAKDALSKNTTLIAAWEAIKTVADTVWGGLKAIWEGLVESFQENLPKVQTALSGLGEAASALWEAIKTAFASIASAFQGLFGSEGATVGAEAAFEVLKTVAASCMDILAVQVTTAIELITSAFNIFAALLRGDWQGAWLEYKNYLQTIWDGIVEILDILGLKDVITAGWKSITAATIYAWEDLKSSISLIWDTIVSWFSDALQGLIDTVTGWMPEWMKKWLGVGEDAGQNLADGLTSKESDVETAADKLVTAITKPLSMAKETIAEIGQDLADSLAVSLGAAEAELKQSAYDIGKSITGEMAKAIEENTIVIESSFDKVESEVEQSSYDIGVGVVDGMAKAIDDSTFTLESSISGLNQAAQNEFTSFWRVESPSDLTFGYGEDITQGLIDGIDSLTGEAVSTVESLGDDITMGFVNSLLAKGKEIEAAGRAMLAEALITEGEAQEKGAVTGEAYTNGVAEAISKGTDVVEKATGDIVEALETGADAAQEAAGDIAEALETGADMAADAAQRAAGHIVELAEVMGEGVEQTGEYTKAQGKVKDAVEASIEPVKELTKVEEEHEQIMEEAARAAEKLRLAEHGLLEETQELIKAYNESIAGGERQADTLVSLQGAYDEVTSKIDLLGEYGIEASEELLSIVDALEEVGIKGEEYVSAFLEAMRDMWSSFKSLVSSAVGDTLNDITDYFRDKEQAAKDHADRLLGIETDYGERSRDSEEGHRDTLFNAALQYQRKCEDIERDYQRALGNITGGGTEERSKIESRYRERMEDAATSYGRRREDIERGYTDKVLDLERSRERALADEVRAYEDSKQTIGQVLWANLQQFLTSLREELFAKAAKHAIEALALAFIPGMQILAAGHAAAAAAYFAGGAALAIGGFAKGAVFDQPTVLPPMMVAEAGYKEAFLPLSPSVFGEIGQGIVNALSVPAPALVGVGGGGGAIYAQRGRATQVFTEVRVYLGQEEVTDFVIERIQHKSKLLTGSRSTAAGLTRRYA